MNIQQLEYFVNLAQTEHMTKSAELLKTSQPRLSYTIHELEKELGVALFEKKGRNIQLTKHGKLYCDFVESALNQLKQGNDFIKNTIDPFKGKINLGFIYTMGSSIVPMLTKQFLKKFPDVTFNFKQSNSKKLLSDLLKGKVNIAIVSHLFDYPQLEFTPLVNEKMVVVVPDNHPLAKEKEINLMTLNNEKLVYFGKNSGLRYFLDNLLTKLNIKINPVIEVEEDHTILGFVSQGFGVAILPDIPSIEAYKVKKLNITNHFKPRTIFLATQKGYYLPPVITTFKNFCLDMMTNEDSKYMED